MGKDRLGMDRLHETLAHSARGKVKWPETFEFLAMGGVEELETFDNFARGLGKWLKAFAGCAMCGARGSRDSAILRGKSKSFEQIERSPM